jgi:hypothetical protein
MFRRYSKLTGKWRDELYMDRWPFTGIESNNTGFNNNDDVYRNGYDWNLQ